MEDVKKYDLDLEEGAGLISKTERNYILGKIISAPEDMMPPGHPKSNYKKALIFIEATTLFNSKQAMSFDLEPAECKQLADFLLKVWEESK